MKKPILLTCECSDVEHSMIVTPGEDSTVYVYIHLVHFGFFARLVTGLKYIFGKQSKHGAFEEVMLSKQHVKSLTKIIKHLNP